MSEVPPYVERADFAVCAERNPRMYEQTLRDLKPTEGSRYARTVDGHTFCNIFLWDGTRALGCEIPHWVHKDFLPSQTGQGVELTANGIHAWLYKVGKQFGWRKVTHTEGIGRAADGFPTILVWKNPNSKRPGHVAFLLPEGRVIQAGRKNGVMTVNEAFGSLPFDTWTHD